MCTDRRNAVVRATRSVRLRIDERSRRSGRYAYSMGIEFYLPSLKTMVQGGSYASSLMSAAITGFVAPNGFTAIITIE